MRIQTLVQHHPSRAALLPALLAGLPAGAIVVPDPDPGAFRAPWRTYRACLEAAAPAASHVLIVQDDVLPCARFPAALPLAVAARPDRLLVLFHAGVPRQSAFRVARAYARGEAWAEMFADHWCPAIANVWPARMIRPFLDFVDAQDWPERFAADDEIIGRFLRHLREPPLAVVPSLVEHPDIVPVVRGDPRRSRAGANKDRVAAVYDHDLDPGLVSWDAGPR